MSCILRRHLISANLSVSALSFFLPSLALIPSIFYARSQTQFGVRRSCRRFYAVRTIATPHTGATSRQQERSTAPHLGTIVHHPSNAQHPAKPDKSSHTPHTAVPSPQHFC